MLTVKECLQGAWQCLLNGDKAGRDEWCAKAEHIQKQIIRVKEGGPLMPGKPIRLVEGADCVLTPERQRH